MKEILENNPKCTELIRNYYRTTFLNNFKSHLEPDEIQEYFTKMSLGINELATLIESNPIYLIYMFDEQGLGIDITVDYITSDKGQYRQYLGQIDIFTIRSSTRKECEKAVIIQAIKTLEEKL